MLRFNHAFKTTLIPRDARDILYILTDFFGVKYSLTLVKNFFPSNKMIHFWSRDRTRYDTVIVKSFEMIYD